MPNAKVLSEKQAIVAELTEKLKTASSGVLVDYKGITVAQDTACLLYTSEPTEEETKAAMEAAKAKADAFVAAVNSSDDKETAFAELAPDYVSELSLIHIWSIAHKPLIVIGVGGAGLAGHRHN